MKKIALLLLAAGFAGCVAAQTPIPQPDSSAARLFDARCGMCHSVPSPKRFYYDRWVTMVDAMSKIMAAKHAPLGSDERRTILAYLKENAR